MKELLNCVKKNKGIKCKNQKRAMKKPWKIEKQKGKEKKIK